MPGIWEPGWFHVDKWTFESKKCKILLQPLCAFASMFKSTESSYLFQKVKSWPTWWFSRSSPLVSVKTEIKIIIMTQLWKLTIVCGSLGGKSWQNKPFHSDDFWLSSQRIILVRWRRTGTEFVSVAPPFHILSWISFVVSCLNLWDRLLLWPNYFYN